MNILFVLEHYYPYIGGAEKLFKQLAEALAANGYKVDVVTTHFQPDLKKNETFNKVEIHRIACYNRYLFTAFSLPKVLQLAKNADFIHTTTYNAAFPSWIASFLTRKKTILTFHEYWGKLWFKLPYLSGIQRILFYTYEKMISKLPFDYYVAVSNATKKDLIAENIKEEKIYQIYNGIEYEKFQQYDTVAKKPYTFIYYGRLGVSKGLDLIIPAWEIFAKKHPNCVLELVISKKPKGLFNTIVALIEKLRVSGSVKLFHHLEETVLFQKIAYAQAVLIPSYKEGFCFVAAEAMALRKPIISSGKGALKEVVSGKFIELPALTQIDLSQALEDAYNDKWTISPYRDFPLSESVRAYFNFYENKKQ